MRTPVRPRSRRSGRAVGALVLAFALACGSLGSATSGAAATNRVYSLASVSCVSPADCFVVGSSTVYDAGAQASTPLIARWNGTTWSIMRSANRSGRNMNSLSDISCTAPSFCMAVGKSATTTNSVVRATVGRTVGRQHVEAPPEPGDVAPGVLHEPKVLHGRRRNVGCALGRLEVGGRPDGPGRVRPSSSALCRARARQRASRSATSATPTATPARSPNAGTESDGR